MPFYLDRHDVRDATPEEIARAHAADMAVQEPYGVRYVTYWFDSRFAEVTRRRVCRCGPTRSVTTEADWGRRVDSGGSAN